MLHIYSKCTSQESTLSFSRDVVESFVRFIYLAPLKANLTLDTVHDLATLCDEYMCLEAFGNYLLAQPIHLKLQVLPLWYGVHFSIFRLSSSLERQWMSTQAYRNL